MFPTVGTIRNSVNLSVMANKWEQKKQNINSKNTGNLTAEDRELIMYQQEADDIRENRKPAGIDAKLEAGETLTPEEIDYLRKNNPEALKEYEEIQRERESYRKALQRCRSKEEVERLKMTKTSQFMAATKDISNNANIPKGEKIKLLKKILMKEAGVDVEHNEFIKTLQYVQLPEKDEDLRKKVGADSDNIDNSLIRNNGESIDKDTDNAADISTQNKTNNAAGSGTDEINNSGNNDKKTGCLGTSHEGASRTENTKYANNGSLSSVHSKVDSGGSDTLKVADVKTIDLYV